MIRLFRNSAPIIVLMLVCINLPTYANETKPDGDAISGNTGNKLEKLCKKLELPMNEDAQQELLEFIDDWLGTSYCYGGNSKSCIDCSAFTNQVYEVIYHKTIPRVSRDIYAKSLPIEKYALYQGDLVFFATSGGKKVNHVGIYLWDGYFVHASSSKGVVISHLRQSYYTKTFVGGGAWFDDGFTSN